MHMIAAGARPHLERLTDHLMGVERETLRERAFWQSRATLAGRPSPPLELTAAFDSRIRKGDSTKVTGKVLRGDNAVPGARVAITWISSSGTTKALGTTRTNAKGRYAVSVSPTKSGTLRITATSEGQRAVIKRPITVLP